MIAPKIHVKPIRNKVHSKQTNESSKPATSSSSSRPTTSSDKNVVESRSVFEVSQAYRGASNLPPLRVSKRLEETMIQQNRKKQGAEMSRTTQATAAVPIVRHSFHEDMISKCLQTTAHVEVESTSSGSEHYKRRRESKKTKGQDDKPTTTTRNKKYERRNDTESVEPSNVKSNDVGKARNVSFDIYNIHTQQKRVKPDDSNVFASSDFV